MQQVFRNISVLLQMKPILNQPTINDPSSSQSKVLWLKDKNKIRQEAKRVMLQKDLQQFPRVMDTMRVK